MRRAAAAGGPVGRRCRPRAVGHAARGAAQPRRRRQPAGHPRPPSRTHPGVSPVQHPPAVLVDAAAAHPRTGRSCGSRIAATASTSGRHHVRMGKEVGLTDDEIDGVAARRGGRRVRPRGACTPSTNSRTSPNISDADLGGAGRAPRRASAHGLRLHDRLLRRTRHGHQHFWRTNPTQEEVRTLAHFPKPAAGSWTENWPELGTAPVNYTDSIDPEHFEARAAGDLQEDLAQRRPRRAAAQERAATSPARCRRPARARR